MRNLIAVTLLLLSTSGAHGAPCVNVAHELSTPEQVLSCELILSSWENNWQHTLNALHKASVQVCSKAADLPECWSLYTDAIALFKQRMGALALKKATVLADAIYGDGRTSGCPLEYIDEAVCVAVGWK